MSHAYVQYRRIDGQVVANGWEGLTSGQLQNPINITELNTVHNHSHVWTNTLSTGQIYQTSGNSCYDWTSGFWSAGATGDSSRIDQGWSSYGAQVCWRSGPIYCIEQ